MSGEPTAAGDDELTTTIRLLVAEIDQGLGLDRWVFVRRWSVLSKAYAGAALRHCSILLEEMDHARRVGRETTVRILLRTHLETWLVGMYLVFGDDEALDAIAADYLSTMEKWERQLTAYNDKTQRPIENAERRNAKIRADNDGKARWNRLHPTSRLVRSSQKSRSRRGNPLSFSWLPRSSARRPTCRRGSWPGSRGATTIGGEAGAGLRRPRMPGRPR
jgi:hypothetical protein